MDRHHFSLSTIYGSLLCISAKQQQLSPSFERANKQTNKSTMGACGSKSSSAIVTKQQPEEQFLPNKQKKQIKPLPPDEHTPVYWSLPPNTETVKATKVSMDENQQICIHTTSTALSLAGIQLANSSYEKTALGFCKARCCDDRDLFLSFETTDTTSAWVWVQNSSNGFVCINEGLIAHGLSLLYIPPSLGAGGQSHKMQQLAATQSQARSDELGFWKNDFVEATVHVVDVVYHRKGCKHLQQGNAEEMEKSEAMDLGLHACRLCRP